MKQFKKCSVVMLTTKKAISSSKPMILKDQKTRILSFEKLNGLNPERLVSPQHLYILSNEEIKEKDYFINIDAIVGDNHDSADILVLQASEIDAKTIKNKKFTSCKKVVASTDSTLGLPEPSTMFVKAYVRHQGNISDILVKYCLKPITDYAKDSMNPRYDYYLDNKVIANEDSKLYYVQTEFDSVLYPVGAYELGRDIILVPKVDKNNTITIKSVKDTYQPQEVIDLIKKFNDEAMLFAGGGCPVLGKESLDMWIEMTFTSHSNTISDSIFLE